MRGAILYGPGDVRFEERAAPEILKPTDAIVSISATCVCGSDLWPYRGIGPVSEAIPMGHEYCGIVEEVGGAVRTVVVVGDGAVGLLGVLSAKQMGAARIIAMSRHQSRQSSRWSSGATDIVTERGDAGVARIKDLTKGIGADSVLECVGAQRVRIYAMLLLPVMASISQRLPR
jgi:threonine dehydrogenase-like Zn-dependent dehydrogenase